MPRSQETEDVTLQEATVKPGVEAVLMDPSKGRYFIAEVGLLSAMNILVFFPRLPTTRFGARSKLLSYVMAKVGFGWRETGSSCTADVWCPRRAAPNHLRME